MPGDFLKEDIETMQDTDEFAHIITVGDNSFSGQFVLEDDPRDMFDETVEGANAFIVVETKYVADLTPGVFVTVGEALDDDQASGLAGGDDEDAFIDPDDDETETAGLYQMYVLKVSQYGDDDLMKQVFLSKDKQ